MTINGYSDRINHALAFAAKHHDRQVRKGTRLPYLTHPANVAIILTRYGRDEDIVIAGILHDVIEDCVRENYTRAMLEQRIGDKFGMTVLDTVLAVCHSLYEEFRDPASVAPPVLHRMVEAGLLGRKAGRGFYDYTKS